MKETKNQQIVANLVKAFNYPNTLSFAIEWATGDYIQTFLDLGMRDEEARELCAYIMQTLRKVCSAEFTLEAAEGAITEKMKGYAVGGRGLLNVLNEKVAGRSNIVVSQIKPYFDGVTGPVIDFGCGDGSVGQILHDQTDLSITGYDVISYPVLGVGIPLMEFDGKTVPVADGHFETACVMNVIHHEADNEQILAELTRIVSQKLVVIETVPNPTGVGDPNHTAEMAADEKSRVFMNDYLYNRLFHFGAEIPVPGTYETAEGWIARFAKHGWKAEVSIDLGIDQEVIRDRHHLYVFVRE